MNDLSPRQAAVLAFIRDFTAAHRYAPSWADIRGHLGVKSNNSARFYVRALARKGVIEFTPNIARGIRLIGPDAGPPDLPRSDGSDLTTRQAEMFGHVVTYIEEYGHAPSRRDLTRLADCQLNAVQGHVKALVRKGYLDRGPARGRTLVPLKRIVSETAP